MTHLSREELIAWRDQPSDDLRSAVIGHLALCGQCASVYAELVRTRPSSEAPKALNPADFVARGRTTGRQSSRSMTRWFVPLAAAAGLVLAVMVFRPGPEPEIPVTRGGGVLAPRAPMGAVDAAREFSWEGLADTSYRFELSMVGGDHLHDARVQGTRYQLPQEVQARLKPGVEYQWIVAQLDTRGDTLDVSRPATFVIR